MVPENGWCDSFEKHFWGGLHFPSNSIQLNILIFEILYE